MSYPFPVVECVTFKINEKLKKDPSLVNPTAKTLYEQPGCEKVLYGQLMEDPDTAMVFIRTFVSILSKTDTDLV
jgi:hypothetical protein